MQRKKSHIDPVDFYVGQRLRQARNMRNETQTGLAKKAGLTFQQIQKYEKGSNRISASRLVQLATILNMPVAWFFEKVPTGRISGSQESLKEFMPAIDMNLFYRAESVELLRVYYAITDSGQRHYIRQMLLGAAVTKDIMQA